MLCKPVIAMTRQVHLVLLSGLPGAGKTTLANNLVASAANNIADGRGRFKGG